MGMKYNVDAKTKPGVDLLVAAEKRVDAGAVEINYTVADNKITFESGYNVLFQVEKKDIEGFEILKDITVTYTCDLGTFSQTYQEEDVRSNAYIVIEAIRRLVNMSAPEGIKGTRKTSVDPVYEAKLTEEKERIKAMKKSKAVKAIKEASDVLTEVEDDQAPVQEF